MSGVDLTCHTCGRSYTVQAGSPWWDDCDECVETKRTTFGATCPHTEVTDHGMAKQCKRCYTWLKVKE